MTKTTASLLKGLAKMSGDKKVRIALELSEMVRNVSLEGTKATKTARQQWKLANKISLSR